MIKKIERIIYLLLMLLVFMPITADAWTPGERIVPDCDSIIFDEQNNTLIEDPGCHFDDILVLINNLLDVFIWLSIPIATLLFAWIGWTLIVEGDKSSARSVAKKRLGSLLKGLFFILAGWLVVKLIVSGLAKEEYVNKFLDL